MGVTKGWDSAELGESLPHSGSDTFPFGGLFCGSGWWGWAARRSPPPKSASSVVWNLSLSPSALYRPLLHVPRLTLVLSFSGILGGFDWGPVGSTVKGSCVEVPNPPDVKERNPAVTRRELSHNSHPGSPCQGPLCAAQLTDAKEAERLVEGEGAAA